MIAAAAGAAIPARQLAAQEKADRATRGMASPKIKDVRVIATAPAGLRLTVVKIVTDQDGLYGYGCGTFTQRAEVVNVAVEKYLRPFLIGKPADRIDDLWQAMYNSSYWRNGPDLNNAMSGVDQALWDIKGRQAGMPIYQLAGGKHREAADCYSHAAGRDIPELMDSARSIIAQGFRNVRVQVGVAGMAGYGAGRGDSKVAALHQGPVFEPAYYIRSTLKMLEACRKELGEEIELLHDVHERVSPNQAVQLAKAVEPFRLFFLEDVLSPEDIAYFRLIRQQCATPLAMGELFNSPHEWTPLISERLIDYMRMHVTQMGGFTPARKVAAMGEIYGVKTAWHGPGDVSPVGHAANVHLDLAIPNFGIQEGRDFTQAEQDVFPGCPVLRNGSYTVSDRPGLGIDVNEDAARRFPITDDPPFDFRWGNYRRRDGTIVKP